MALVYNDLEYYMVRDIPEQKSRLADEQQHHRLTGISGFIRLVFRLMETPYPSPLHIGSGEIELDKEGIYQAVTRNKGVPVIPGSGIKGAVRAFAEALGPCCLEANCRADSLCPCCALFGTFGFQGRVAFSEALSQTELKTSRVAVPVRWGGRNTRGRRFYWHDHYESWVNANIGETERLEVVLPSAEFHSTCYFHNLRNEEMGFLFLSMGLVPEKEFHLKLGGGKNRGLGSVRVSILEINQADTNRYTSLSQQPPLRETDKLVKSLAFEYLASLTDPQLSIVRENLAAFRQESYRGLTAADIKQRFIDRAERQGRRN